MILKDDKDKNEQEGDEYLRDGNFKDEVKIKSPGGTFNLFFNNA